ncbi:MAG: M23 family metallopeptidase [Pseudomonadota bacterium]
MMVRSSVAILTVLALAACDERFDLDVRSGLGGFDTSAAARAATAPRPEPDERGVISYPGYQVMVANDGDTVAAMAARIDVDAERLAGFNGLEPTTSLRGGEIIALPDRIEAAPAIDIAALATGAIDRAPEDPARAEAPAAAPTEAATPEVAATPIKEAPEPIRHKVQRGETAFTIARLYGVPVSSLAEWNGLGPDFLLREGQFLLIPVLEDGPIRVMRPGIGSTTPTPPSSATPVPEVDETPARQATAPAPAEPVVAEPADTAEFLTPVAGTVIRSYAKGRNEGVDFGAPAGTAVKAAADGVVAAVTRNTSGVPIIVVRHEGSLLTVYTQVAGLRVEKGDSVSRGDTIAVVREGDPSYLHFEVRNGLESVDPAIYLNL